uniref:Uncharacterized protein n=1 Tax=Arundo donax TaxID=35708 RepID=A0A0A8YV35_ARUDO
MPILTCFPYLCDLLQSVYRYKFFLLFF